MNFLRHHTTENTSLKMTAMIDVVFLLLIFFIVGTKFRQPEGELDAYLPDEGAPVEVTERKLPVDEIRVSLRMSTAGVGNPIIPPAVLLDGKGLGPGISTGSMKWLSDELHRLGNDEAVRTEVPVIIEAEPGLAYRWVIQALNITRKARFKKVHFAASRRSAPAPAGSKKPG